LEYATITRFLITWRNEMQKIGGVPRSDVLEVGEEVMKRFVELPDNPRLDRKGGYFAVMSATQGRMLCINELGEAFLDNAPLYFAFCQEKVLRLFAHLNKGHISSWQSRDLEKEMYGGGIIKPLEHRGHLINTGLIGAISGLPEHGDEAVTMMIFLIFGWITLEDTRKIVAISQNPLFPSLLSACADMITV
jgi:hypothetical protein